MTAPFSADTPVRELRKRSKPAPTPNLPARDPSPSASPHEPLPVTASPTSNGPANGWRPLGDEQRNGKSFFVAASPDTQGVMAYYGTTRVCSHARWITQGKWVDALSRVRLPFDPVVYREDVS